MFIQLSDSGRSEKSDRETLWQATQTSGISMLLGNGGAGSNKCSSRFMPPN